MKILLINPPYSRLRMTKECTEMVAPLGLAYLAATTARDGFSPVIFDANYSDSEKLNRLNDVKGLMDAYHLYSDELSGGGHPVWQECYRKVQTEKPDIIGITTLTPVLGSAKKLASICREAAPGATIVFGGFHPTCRPEDVLSDGSADVVVRGEGEYTFLELAQNLRDGSPIRDTAGISFMENGTLHNNPDRPLIENLSELPSIADFAAGAASGKMPIQFGRGCTFSCKFCSDSAIWRKKSRHIPADQLAAEISAISKKHGIREFTFVDGTFNIRRERVMELCEAIIKRKLDILWDALVRADTLDDEMLAMCRRAGCVQMNVGVESGSPAVLKDLRKAIKIDGIHDDIARIRRHGIAAVSFFCIGTPSETPDDMKATRNLIAALPHDYVILHLFTPMPGSRYFEELLADGLVSEDHDYNSFGYKSPSNYFTRNMSREEFEHWRGKVSDAVEAVNSRGRLISRILLNNIAFYLRHPLHFIRRALQFRK